MHDGKTKVKELLTSELGEEDERSERKKLLSSSDCKSAKSQLQIGGIRPISDKVVKYKDFFPNSGQKEIRRTIVRNNVQLSAQFDGFCPYGFDQAFYISPDEKKILLGTFVGTSLVKQEELSLDLMKKPVTLMKVVGDFLAIGFCDGSFNLVPLSESQGIHVIKQKGFRIDGEQSFVRDLHLYKQPGSENMIVCLIYVTPCEKFRQYSTAQYLIQHSRITKCFEEPEKLYKVEHKDKNEQTKLEHRREFYWWEQFRTLGTSCVAYQIDQQSLGILDLEYSIKCLICPYPQFYKCHVGIHSDNYLNWVFLISPKHSFSLDPETNQFQKPIELIVVNAEGVQRVVQNSSENFVDDLSQDPENSLVTEHEKEIHFEFFKIHNDYETGGIISSEPWRPFDTTMINVDSKGQRLLVAGTMGLFKVDLYNKKPRVEQIEDENFYQLTKSYCSRIIAVTGRTKHISLYDAQTMIPLCFLPISNVFHLKMSSEQIFYKSKLKRWNVLGLQETENVRTLNYRLRVQNKEKTFQKILYDKVDGDNQDYAVGISSKQMTLKPELIQEAHVVFEGSEVTATDLNKNIPSAKEVILMTQEEAKEGFKVISVGLIKNSVTWLLVKEPGSQKGKIFAKQANMKTGEIRSVFIKIRFGIFGGFYLSAQRDQENSAIVVLADDRDLDIRKFEKKHYLRIDFKEQKYNKFGSPKSIQSLRNPDEELEIDEAKKDPLFNVLNDGQVFTFNSPDGKHVCTNNKLWDIEAKEMRISPQANRVVLETSEMKYFVAELNLDYDCSQKEDKNNQKFLSKSPIKTEDDSIEHGLQALSTVMWLTNDYFAVGKFINKTTQPQKFVVYRADNGTPLLEFSLSHEFEWLKSNTLPNLHSENISGIYDKKTHKIYHISIFSLLHLGARNCDIIPDCEIFNKEKQEILQDNKLMVLGLHVPALFFIALTQLHGYSNEPSKQRPLISHKIFRYSTIEYKKEGDLKLQNMLVFLCKNTYPKLLDIWLKKDENYFADGCSLSPISYTSVVTAKIVQGWLTTNDKHRQDKIYCSISLHELETILKLPIDMIGDIFTNVTCDYSDDYEFNSANIKDGAFATIENIDQLTDKKRLNEISQELFEYDSDDEDKTIPTPGDPFKFNVSLMKFNMCPGSYESRSLLYDISVAGDENLDIYSNKLIQKLLDFKFQKAKWLVHIMFLSQLSYLFCVVLFGMNSMPEFIMVCVFLFIFMLREWIQFYALYKMNDGFSYKIFIDYFGFWNILDWVNMSCMIGFLVCYTDMNDATPEEILENTTKNKFQAAFYSIMALITWINLLQYLRLYEKFRFIVDLVKAIFLSADTWKFFIVMFIMIMAFSSSLFLLNKKRSKVWQANYPDEDYESNPYILEGVKIDKGDLIPLFQQFVFTSFGDFGMYDDLADDDYMQAFIFSFSLLFMCLIMLNLLIGILSEVLAETIATKEQSDYAALCGIIFDLETTMFWVPCRKKSKEEKQKEFMHLIFAEQISDFDQEQETLEQKVDQMGQDMKGMEETLRQILKKVSKKDKNKYATQKFRVAGKTVIAANRLAKSASQAQDHQDEEIKDFSHLAMRLKNSKDTLLATGQK